MLDTLTEHLNPGMFVIALIGHVIAESSAKFALSGVRHLGYLAALTLLPVLLRTVEQHRAASSVSHRPRKARSNLRGGLQK